MPTISNAPNGAKTNLSGKERIPLDGIISDPSTPDTYIDIEDALQSLYPQISSIAGLKAIPTVDRVYGIYLFNETTTNKLRAYVLNISSEAEDSPGTIRPDDFDSGTNNKVWKIADTGAVFHTGIGTQTSVALNMFKTSLGVINVQSSANITITISNVVAGANHIVSIKKLTASDITVTFAGTGLSFYGYNSADFGTTPSVTLSGANNDIFDISFLARSLTQIGVAIAGQGN